MGPPGGLHHVPATTSTLVVPNSATNSAPLVVGDHRRVLLVRQKKSVTNVCHLFVTNGHVTENILVYCHFGKIKRKQVNCLVT